MTATDPSPGISDWSRDFDILDEGYVTDPAWVWNLLRDACPVAHTDRRGSTWLPVSFEDLQAIAHDTDRFSSRDIAVITPYRDQDPTRVISLIAPPITSDPPEHTSARRLLLPRFGPSTIDEMTPITRDAANRLIDGFLDAGAADAALDYAQHIPVRVIATMLGLPPEDEATFTDWAVRLLQQGFQNIESATGAISELITYFIDKIAEREALAADRRPDDLLTFVVEAELDGEPLSGRHRVGICFLLLIAGIDTTWSAIGASLWHLARTPEDRRRLVAEPELLPVAMEELLRAYAPVTMARLVKEDHEFEGCPMKAGEWVLLSFPAANRDPEAFERADEVVIDREVNRHAAFGLGIHRCAGSNLARMELRVALEAWLARHPEFGLADPAAVAWSGGQVRGPRRLPISIG